ncbi:PREDICTED: uncharacterized protein LOC109479356 [Branchiostoma belcheri]|uniref:Uncharacterized protein LOC109479356 n=1 Tax=Branchiostoma belcheri TaxID=7741 RepID=A0A6P5A0Z2_BRABE|nr:PREDICTED: uncharacterized protein LOC109479356 [Branchiostoma belcheri]
MEASGHTKLHSLDEVHLNVGGQWYCANKNLLVRYTESKLYQAVSLYGSDTNVLFVEGDGRMFQHVLNFITTGELVLPPGFNEHELLIHEARETYGIRALVEKLERVRKNDSEEHFNDKGLRIGHARYRSLEMNTGRPFLTNIAVLQKYPLLLQNSSLAWLTENGFAFIHCDNDNFRHILNSCHHGVCLVPQYLSEAGRIMDELKKYGITDKERGYFSNDDNSQSNQKKPANDIEQQCCPPIYIMAIEILQRVSSTHNLGRLEISLTRDGKGLVVHGSGNLFAQASQCLGVSRLLLLDDISDFHDMYKAVKVSNIPALVSAVEDFQRSPPFLQPAKSHCPFSCPPRKADLQPLHSNEDTANHSSFGSEVVTVYVGNQTYEASRHVLTEAARHSRIPKCVDGMLYITGDAEMFRHILNFFRTGKLMLPPDFAEYELLLCEANHLGVSCIVSMLDQPRMVLKKAYGKEVKEAAEVKKQKRTKKKRQLCSCPECFPTSSEKAPSRENLSSLASIESEAVLDQQEIVSGIDAHGTQGSAVSYDAHRSRNIPEHSVFIKMAKTGASVTRSDKDNSYCSHQHKWGVYQGRASVCQVGPDGRLQIELILSRPDNDQQPINRLQEKSSDKSDFTKQSGNPKTLMEFSERCLSSASQRLMQMSKTVLEIQTLTKTDISIAKKQFPVDSIINPSNSSNAVSSLPDPAQSESKVAINTDHSYSHPPSKDSKSVTNKLPSSKGEMKPPKSKPKLVALSDAEVEAHCHKSESSTGYNLQGQDRCERTEDFGYIAVIRHPHVHGQQEDKGSPYKPFTTSRLYIGAQEPTTGNDVAALSLLNHTQQLCADRLQRNHCEGDTSTKGKAYPAGRLTEDSEDGMLDVEENRQTVAYSGTTVKPMYHAVGETKSAMACHTVTEEHLVMENKDSCSDLNNEAEKTIKSPDASIASTPKGSIHLRNLTKLCSQVSWLHSVPQQPDITTQDALADGCKEKTASDCLDVSEVYAMKENADPNTEPTEQEHCSKDATHADLSKAPAVASGYTPVRVTSSPIERQSTELPLASTPVEEGSSQQRCILLPLAAKDVVYARMCHRFLLGVIEDSKKLGDVPDLTAEVARLVHRLWNADISPSTFVGCLSHLGPFNSHTCEHLTPWITRSLSPARWYALSMLELVEKHPSACSLTTSRVADIL